MATLLDAVVRHAVDLVHYSNWVVRRIIAVLNRADADLFAQLVVALERLPAESFTVERLEAVLANVRRLNADAYAQVKSALEGNLSAFVAEEARWIAGVHRGPVVSFAAVTAEQAYAAAMARPFQGRLLREWAASIEADRMTRIRDTIRLGYLEGQTIDQMVRRVRGTKAAGYADGIIEIDRRHAETIVRSAVSHTAATVRDRFYEANADAIESVIWTATLDRKTSASCRLRDGKRYKRNSKGRYLPVGHTIPWCTDHGCGPGAAHFNCRSTSIGLLKGQTEAGGTRASIQYRDGERPTGAQVRATTTYGDWLKRQPAAVQDEVLGRARGALFRRGGLEIEDFANDKGRTIDLATLRARNEDAFRRAGLSE